MPRPDKPFQAAAQHGMMGCKSPRKTPMRKARTMIRLPALAALATLSGLLATSPAWAADPLAPAKTLMDMISRNWDENEGDYIDYFGDAPLKDLYSKAFADAYREAAKHPVFDDPQSGPFDYDVMTDSQDGCPVTDIGYKAGETKDGATDVEVTFKFFTCWTNDETVRDKVTKLHVAVAEEDGRAVIADIIRERDEGDGSLMKEMQDIAKGQ
jgi:hypothetical protein